MYHIVIITGQHMAANPRVWKEANLLVQHGYEVTVLTTLYDQCMFEKDQNLLHESVRYRAAINLLPGSSARFTTIHYKLQRHGARTVKLLFGVDSRSLLLYGFSAQLHAALQQEADLYIGHQEAGLLIGTALLKKGKKVAFDFEDWYSQDFLNRERPVSLLRSHEAFALKNACYVSCPSKAMAGALREAYAPSQLPAVLYNSFSVREGINLSVPQNANTLVWFSQVVGPGRGIERFVAALKDVATPVELHFAGRLVKHFDKTLALLSSGQHRLFFHGQMEHHRLIPFLSGFRIGLALEDTFPRSRNLTVTNKIWQYLQAGMRVFATDTAGHREMKKLYPDAIELAGPYQGQAWADRLYSMLQYQSHDRLQQVNHFSKNGAWEVQAGGLLARVQNALEQ